MHRDINSNGNDSRAGTWKSGAIAHFTYDFDKVGNRTTQATTGRYKSPSAGPKLLHDMDYDYDGLDRLTQATYTNLSNDYEKFRYDVLGNRDGDGSGSVWGYKDTRPPSPPGDFTIGYANNNLANEYVTIDSNGVEYDAAGNLTKDEDGFFMAYDADSQLTAVYADSNGDGDYDAGTDDVVAEYAYDAMGRRIQFVNHFDGSGVYGSGPTMVTTRYVYDYQNPQREWGAMSNVIAEYDGASTPVRQRYYVHGTSYIDERAVLHDEVDSGSVDYYYLLKDLYSVVGLADTKGKELERYTYDAYGEATLVSIPTGDVDATFSGVVNAADRTAVVGAWTSGQGPCGAGPIYDVTGDGLINAADRTAVVGQWTGHYQNQTIPASGLGNPYFFTGRTLDLFKDAIAGVPGVKQLYHYRARYYEPEHGRFLQRDPAENTDGMNNYDYVNGAPNHSLDPFGLWRWKSPFAPYYEDKCQATGQWRFTGGWTRLYAYIFSQGGSDYGQIKLLKAKEKAAWSRDYREIYKCQIGCKCVYVYGTVGKRGEITTSGTWDIAVAITLRAPAIPAGWEGVLLRRLLGKQIIYASWAPNVNYPPVAKPPSNGVNGEVYKESQAPPGTGAGGVKCTPNDNFIYDIGSSRADDHNRSSW